MTIIPAEQSTAAYFVHKKLSDLLSWASQPYPQPLSDDWADAYRQSIREVIETASGAFAADALTRERLRTAERLALEFIALLANNPTLAVQPVHEWKVAAFRQLFDDLSELNREFRILSEKPQAKGKPRGQSFQPTADPANPPGEATETALSNSEDSQPVAESTGTSVGQVGHPKKTFGPPEDVQAVMRMMTLKRWEGKNPIDVCREYTRQQNSKADSDTIEREAKSLKRKVNRYRK